MRLELNTLKMIPDGEAMAILRPKTWVRIIIAAAALVTLAAGIFAYLYWNANQMLHRAVAEADQLDPGWQLDELLAKREVIPEEENAALVVQAVAKLLPADWPSQQKLLDANELVDDETLENSILQLSPELQVNDEQLQYLKNDLQRAKEALEKAHRLIQLPRGRYDVDWSIESFEKATTKLPCEHCRRIAILLYFEAIVQAQNQETNQALTNARGVMNVGRSIGDEPMAISQFVRWGCEILAIHNIERILAQGQASQNALELAQRLLEDEACQPLLLVMMRGERALTFRRTEAVKKGDLKFSQYSGGGSKWNEWTENWAGSILIGANQAPFLRFQNQCVETAKIPTAMQMSSLQELMVQKESLPVLVRLYVPVYEKLVLGSIRNQALLCCAYVGLAVERHRLAHGRWPESLTALVPEFLKEVPADPYNGSPLKYRRLADGVVIYSVGPDGEDNGGNIDRQNPTAKGTDLGFQLWDVAHRRQPWRPMVKKAADDPEK